MKNILLLIFIIIVGCKKENSIIDSKIVVRITVIDDKTKEKVNGAAVLATNSHISKFTDSKGCVEFEFDTSKCTNFFELFHCYKDCKHSFFWVGADKKLRSKINQYTDTIFNYGTITFIEKNGNNFLSELIECGEHKLEFSFYKYKKAGGNDFNYIIDAKSSSLLLFEYCQGNATKFGFPDTIINRSVNILPCDTLFIELP